MIIPKDTTKSIYAVNELEREAYRIGTRQIWHYDPYIKDVGMMKTEHEYYTFGLNFHNLNSYTVSRCRTSYPVDFLLIGE